MKKNLLTCLFLLLLGIVQAYAQNRTVTGTVTSKEDGSTIPGATVKIKGTQTGTQTDINGHYSLSAPKNAILVFSFVGYISTEQAVSASGVVNVALSNEVRG